MTEFLVVFSIALLVSVLSGILGLGGAIILIPAYLYFPNLFNINSLDIKTITGVTSVQVFASSVLGVIVHKKKGGVDKSLIYTIGLPMAVSALMGAVFSGYINGSYIILTFAFMAVIGAFLMMIRIKPGSDDLEPKSIEYNKTIALIIAFTVGFLGGMVGAPGAFLLAPLLISVLKIPVRITIGSTLGIILLTSFTASAGKIIAGQVNFLITFYAVAGSVIGILIGSNLSHKIHPKHLRYALALVIIVAAIEMFVSYL